MSLVSFKNNVLRVKYEDLHALVVDDYPGMRSALKLTLANFGVTRIELAASATEVLYKVKNTRYDLILCDYNLADGRDGQQLLEELRFRGLISSECVFIMVTAEAGYEKVMGVAELLPDDYLLKPFSAEVMRNRLENILMRKLVFSEAYAARDNHELEKALVACDHILKHSPKYLIDALRMKGELYVALGRFEEAEALYARVVEMRAIPWARLGLARALQNRGKLEEAEEILHDVLEQQPELVSAYDLLADVQVARKDTAAAQKALQRGVAVSARTVRRQQRLGEVAVDNGDLETARQAYSAVIEKGRNSVFVSPADFGHLCKVQVEQGDLNGALATLKSGRMALQGSAQGQLIEAVARSLVHSKSGNVDEVARAMADVETLSKAGVRGDDRLMLDFAGVCMAQGRHEQADAVVREIARNAHDNESLLKKARSLYEQAGRAETGEGLLKQATAQVRSLNNEAVILAHKGQFRAAVEKLQDACWEAPHNVRVLMNAVWVMLKCIEQEGMDHDLIEEARKHLDDAERLNPGHTRLPMLRNQIKEIEARFGIARRSS